MNGLGRPTEVQKGTLALFFSHPSPSLLMSVPAPGLGLSPVLPPDRFSNRTMVLHCVIVVLHGSSCSSWTRPVRSHLRFPIVSHRSLGVIGARCAVRGALCEISPVCILHMHCTLQMQLQL